MLRFLVYTCIAGFLLTACSKNNDREESAFYGRWLNTNTPNDTLWFSGKNGKSIIRLNNSFNPGLPHYEEYEYRYKDGKLAVILPGIIPYTKAIDSFTWIQTNQEFAILGYQLYFFMSSSATHFTYKRIF